MKFEKLGKIEFSEIVQKVSESIGIEKCSEILIADNLNTSDPIKEKTISDSINFFLCKKLMFSMVIYCLKGKIDITVNQIEYEIESNHVLWITRGSIIDKIKQNFGDKKGWMAISDNNIALSADNLMINTIKQLSVFKTTLYKIKEKYSAHFFEDLEQIKQIIKDNEFKFKEDIISYLMLTMAGYGIQNLLEEEGVSTHVTPKRQDEIFYQFMKEVDKNYTKERTISFYANNLCLTPKYMSKAVQEASGRKPSEWIKEYVIRDAKSKLKSKSYTIQEISATLNFSNQSFFGKFFKNAVGCSPKKYQSKH